MDDAAKLSLVETQADQRWREAERYLTDIEYLANGNKARSTADIALLIECARLVAGEIQLRRARREQQDSET